MDADVFVRILAPNSVADIFIYVIFFLSLLMLALIPDKNQQPTALMTAVVFLAMIDKIRQATDQLPIEGLDNKGFATLLIHVMLFVFPWIAAALIRGRGRKDKRGMPVGLLIGLIAALYAVGSFLSPEIFYNT